MTRSRAPEARLSCARRFLGWVIILAAFLLLPFCKNAEEEDLSFDKAFGEMAAATLVQKEICGSWPGYFLLPPERSNPDRIWLCAYSITSGECPFTAYPQECLLIYGG